MSQDGAPQEVSTRINGGGGGEGTDDGMRSVDGRSMLVLYGTETGRSLEIAQEIGQAAERLRFKTTVKELDGSAGLVSAATEGRRPL